MIRALIFDLDDTLVDRDATARNFLYSQHDRMGEPLESVSKEAFANIILKHQNHGYGNRLNAYQKACAELNISGIPARVLLDDFDQNYGGNSVVFEDVQETLQLLSGKYILALITNSRTRWQNAKLDSSGLRPYFQQALISEDCGFNKPDRRIFESCIQKLGLKPHECIYIGDHPVNDIFGALNCGMKAFWIKNSCFESPKKMDGVIQRISDLPAMVEELNAKIG